MRRQLKGQSAMEYLMTYGWAILIIIIVVAVLFSLGVFNPSTYTQTVATGFSGFRVPAGGWQLDSTGTMTVQIESGVGAAINITAYGISIGSTQNSTRPDAGVLLGPGETTTLTLPGLGTRTTGTAYSATVNITYTNRDTGLSGFVSTGTLTGTVS